MSDKPIIITTHAIERLRERSACVIKSPTQAIRGILMNNYWWKGKEEGTWYVKWGKSSVIVVKEDNGVYKAITVIDTPNRGRYLNKRESTISILEREYGKSVKKGTKKHGKKRNKRSH